MRRSDSDADPVLVEAPQALAQGVVELAPPLPGQEIDDFLTAGDEGVPVPPHRIACVGAGHTFWVSGVPRVLGRLDLLDGGLVVEGG